MDWSYLINILLQMIPAVICFSIHELSHGYMAYRLGDDTAKKQGRLTLNPIKHIDPIGFLMLVFMGFGWAKPVSVDMRKFRNPKLGMAATAFAGPASNLLLSLLLMPVYGAFLALGTGLSDTLYYYISQILMFTIYLSISLAVFNLVPIPPLDGSKIIEAVLPERIYYQIMRYERYGMIVLFIALWSGVLSGPLSKVTFWIFENMLYVAEWTYNLASKLV